MTNDHNDWNSWSLCFMLAASMFHACGLYVSRLRPLCFMLAASMFHACGLYLRHMATIRGGLRLGRKEAIRGACCALWLWEAGLQHRGCEAGLKHRGWVCAFWLVLFGRAFSGSFFGFVLFGRSFRGSCFGSFFSWFVLWVRALGRSFRGSCFWSFFSWFFLWFVLLGARMCFLFDALKVLEACVARSEVS